jgi:hypothetical protein
MLASVAANDFLLQGRLIMSSRDGISSAVEDRRFRSNFGATPEICCILWGMLSPENTMKKGVKCCHLLWALMFLKLYVSEHVLCSMANCDQKTFRKWAWLFVLALADLGPDVVSTVVCCCVLQLQNSNVSIFVIRDS